MPRAANRHDCPRGFSRTLWGWIPARLRNLLRARPEVADRLLRCRHGDWATGVGHFDQRSGRRREMCDWCLHYLRGLPEYVCKDCGRARYVHPAKGVPTSRLSVCEKCWRKKIAPRPNSAPAPPSAPPPPSAPAPPTAPAPAPPSAPAPPIEPESGAYPLRRAQGYILLPGDAAGVPADPSHGRVAPPFASPPYVPPYIHAQRIRGAPADPNYVRDVEERNEQLRRELDRAKEEIRELWFLALGASPDTRC